MQYQLDLTLTMLFTFFRDNMEKSAIEIIKKRLREDPSLKEAWLDEHIDYFFRVNILQFWDDFLTDHEGDTSLITYEHFLSAMRDYINAYLKEKYFERPKKKIKSFEDLQREIGDPYFSLCDESVSKLYRSPKFPAVIRLMDCEAETFIDIECLNSKETREAASALLELLNGKFNELCNTN